MVWVAPAPRLGHATSHTPEPPLCRGFQVAAGSIPNRYGWSRPTFSETYSTSRGSVETTPVETVSPCRRRRAPARARSENAPSVDLPRRDHAPRDRPSPARSSFKTHARLFRRRRRSPLRDGATRALGDLRNSRYPPSSTPSRRRRNVRRFELSLLYLSTRDARETPTARRPTLVHSANLLRPAPIDADCPDMTHPRHILPAIVALIGGN